MRKCRLLRPNNIPMFALQLTTMKIVSEESVEQAIDEIEKMTDEDFSEFAAAFAAAQPSMAGYLFIHEDEFTDDDFDIMANLALTIYRAYQIECGTARILSEQEIEEAAMRQMEYLDAIETANEEEISELVEKAFDGTRQPVLLDFAAHELHLMESEGAIEHESGGALIYPILQLTVDLLDIAFNGTNIQVV